MKLIRINKIVFSSFKYNKYKFNLFKRLEIAELKEEDMPMV